MSYNVSNTYFLKIPGVIWLLISFEGALLLFIYEAIMDKQIVMRLSI